MDKKFVDIFNQLAKKYDRVIMVNEDEDESEQDSVTEKDYDKAYIGIPNKYNEMIGWVDVVFEKENSDVLRVFTYHEHPDGWVEDTFPTFDVHTIDEIEEHLKKNSLIYYPN